MDANWIPHYDILQKLENLHHSTFYKALDSLGSVGGDIQVQGSGSFVVQCHD